jgi:hypothetical protein
MVAKLSIMENSDTQRRVALVVVAVANQKRLLRQHQSKEVDDWSQHKRLVPPTKGNLTVLKVSLFRQSHQLPDKVAIKLINALIFQSIYFVKKISSPLSMTIDRLLVSNIAPKLKSAKDKLDHEDEPH